MLGLLGTLEDLGAAKTAAQRQADAEAKRQAAATAAETRRQQAAAAKAQREADALARKQNAEADRVAKQAAAETKRLQAEADRASKAAQAKLDREAAAQKRKDDAEARKADRPVREVKDKPERLTADERKDAAQEKKDERAQKQIEALAKRAKLDPADYATAKEVREAIATARKDAAQTKRDERKDAAQTKKDERKDAAQTKKDERKTAQVEKMATKLGLDPSEVEGMTPAQIKKYAADLKKQGKLSTTDAAEIDSSLLDITSSSETGFTPTGDVYAPSTDQSALMQQMLQQQQDFYNQQLQLQQPQQQFQLPYTQQYQSPYTQAYDPNAMLQQQLMQQQQFPGISAGGGSPLPVGGASMGPSFDASPVDTGYEAYGSELPEAEAAGIESAAVAATPGAPGFQVEDTGEDIGPAAFSPGTDFAVATPEGYQDAGQAPSDGSDQGFDFWGLFSGMQGQDEGLGAGASITPATRNVLVAAAGVAVLGALAWVLLRKD